MLEWDFDKDLKDSKVDENGNAALGIHRLKSSGCEPGSRAQHKKTPG